MEKELQKEISKVSQSFARGFKDMFPSINGSGWLIAAPLSGYLNACHYENTLFELPACNEHTSVAVLKFKDGTQFIPAGGDLKGIYPKAKNWMWID